MKSFTGGPLRRVSCQKSGTSFTAELFFNKDLSTSEKASDFNGNQSACEADSSSQYCASNDTCISATDTCLNIEANICENGIVDIYECDGSLRECCPDTETCERPNCGCPYEGYLGKDGTTCCKSGVAKGLDNDVYGFPNAACCINGGSLVFTNGYAACCKDGYALSGATYSIESPICGCSSEHEVLFNGSEFLNSLCIPKDKNKNCSELCASLLNCSESTVDASGACRCDYCI